MRIIVKFSSIFRSLAGTDTDEVQVVEGATIDDLARQLMQKYSNLPLEHGQTFFVVNDKIAMRDQVLAQDDLVRIFQMFAGG